MDAGGVFLRSRLLTVRPIVMAPLMWCGFCSKQRLLGLRVLRMLDWHDRLEPWVLMRLVLIVV